MSALACGPHYELAIEELCLAEFRLDMQEVDQRRWCSWEDTVEWVGQCRSFLFVHFNGPHVIRMCYTSQWQPHQYYCYCTSFSDPVKNEVKSTLKKQSHENLSMSGWRSIWLPNILVTFQQMIRCWVRDNRRRVQRMKGDETVRRTKAVQFWQQLILKDVWRHTFSKFFFAFECHLWGSLKMYYVMVNMLFSFKAIKALLWILPE